LQTSQPTNPLFLTISFIIRFQLLKTHNIEVAANSLRQSSHSGCIVLFKMLRVTAALLKSSLSSYRSSGFRMASSALKPNIPSLLEVDTALRLYQQSGSNLKFIDGSWHMNKERKPLSEFDAERIVGARYFDIDAVSDKSTTLPHMIPSVDEFSTHMGNLGLKNSDHVVVYTAQGSFSAARVWWTLRLFGHDNVSILNGGLPAWKAAGGPTESGAPAAVEKTTYQAKLNNNLVVKAEDVLAIVQSGAAQIVDARSTARFMGEAPEPRPGLAGGHIPGSLNLPFTAILREDDMTKFRSPLEIKEKVQSAGVILGSNVVFTCGSGVTAAVLYFGMHLLGIDMNKLAVYDGSWSEWGQNPDLPKVNPAQIVGASLVNNI
jgi:thiosulfate/3-mercaptopyruvate sulfurtransferase